MSGLPRQCPQPAKAPDSPPMTEKSGAIGISGVIGIPGTIGVIGASVVIGVSGVIGISRGYSGFLR
ncbi:MAG: hypothetical protein RSD35_04325 [Oscillospiraceae bacterium]